MVEPLNSFVGIRPSVLITPDLVIIESSLQAAEESLPMNPSVQVSAELEIAIFEAGCFEQILTLIGTLTDGMNRQIQKCVGIVNVFQKLQHLGIGIGPGKPG